MNASAGEECDGAGRSEACNDDCTNAACGDGIVNATAGEACDDEGESAVCNGDCSASECGDGVTNATAGEACDGAGESITCDADCTAAECGDGLTNVTAGEGCDDVGESAACNDDCSVSECGDGIPNVTAGEACDDGNEIDDDECTNACEFSSRTVFVSSEMYTGDMGGLAGADANCQSLAVAAGLSGTYLAWLSTATESPNTRFEQDGGAYQLIDGTEVASSYVALTSTDDLAATISLTELGGPTPVGNTSCAGGGFPTVWSGTGTNGASQGSSICADWTSETGGGQWGRADVVNGSWTSWCSGGLCSWESPIYCFEQ